MAMIVLCHIILYYDFIPGSQILPQLFNVGVNVFFLVSGFLYGKKEVLDIKQFLHKRFKRINVPIMIVVIIDIIFLGLVKFDLTLKNTVPYFLNLHGLNFISWRLFSNYIDEIPNLGPLWFTTIIMICYSLIPVFQAIRNKLLKIKNSALIFISSFCALIAVSVIVFYFFDISVFGIATFVFGYFYSSLEMEKRIKHSNFIVFTIIMTAFQFVRLYLNLKIDGTKYYLIFVSISQFVLGLFVFLLIFEIEKVFPVLINKIGNSRVLIYLDSLSFYVYIVHGLFCCGTGIWNVYQNIDNIVLSTFVFLIATAFMANLLKFVTDRLNKLIP